MANLVPPTGWYTTAFNDSGWPNAIQLNNNAAPNIWPENPPLDATEQALLRKHFNLPTGNISNVHVHAECDDAVLAMYMNGTQIFSGSLSFVDVDVPPNYMVAGGANVFAMWITNQAPPGASTTFTITVS